MLSSARIRRILETREDLLALTLKRKTTSVSWCEKLVKREIIMIILKLTKEELKKMYQRARKLMTMHKA